MASGSKPRPSDLQQDTTRTAIMHAHGNAARVGKFGGVRQRLLHHAIQCSLDFARKWRLFAFDAHGAWACRTCAHGLAQLAKELGQRYLVQRRLGPAPAAARASPPRRRRSTRSCFSPCSACVRWWSQIRGMVSDSNFAEKISGLRCRAAPARADCAWPLLPPGREWSASARWQWPAQPDRHTPSPARRLQARSEAASCRRATDTRKPPRGRGHGHHQQRVVRSGQRPCQYEGGGAATRIRRGRDTDIQHDDGRPRCQRAPHSCVSKGQSLGAVAALLGVTTGHMWPGERCRPTGTSAAPPGSSPCRRSRRPRCRGGAPPGARCA